MNSIVISLGGLHASRLGCYGGGWIETPVFDRFAAEGFVFDRCFVESPHPATTRRAWWTGRYQNFCRSGEPVGAAAPQGEFIRSLRSAGIQTILIRDSREVSQDSGQTTLPFDRVVEISRSAGDATSQLFAAARDLLQQDLPKLRWLLFIDCLGAHPPWYPADSTAQHESDSGQDAYTSLVARMDEQFGTFLDFLRAGPHWENLFLMITSDCGTCLKGSSGATETDSQLHEVRMHVPLLLRLPGAHDPTGRSSALVQSIDLLPTICEVMGVPIPSATHGRSLLPIVRLQRQGVRDHALMAVADREWALRTEDWHFILPLPTSESGPAPERLLFVKPDDRWERDNVAKQFPDVADQLEMALRNCTGSLQ